MNLLRGSVAHGGWGGGELNGDKYCFKAKC